LSSGNYDVVQVEEPVFGPFISSSVPRIVTTHTTQLGEFGALLGVLNSTRQITRLAFSGTVGWAFDRLCLGGADVVVPVGETVKAELRRLYGVRDEKLQVVPNAVNVPKEVRKAEAKKEIGIDNLLFLYAGRLIDRKRVEDFVSAIGMLRRRGLQDFSALVVGSGPIKEALENLASRLNLEGCLRFTGYVPDHRFFRILEAADVFVLPSCYEGHPISVLEAMAYGCVPVVSNISQSREIVKTGRNGVTYPLGDLESLTEALLNLASDDELRASFSLSARRSAMDLPWSAVANQYVQIYNALAP
jgi:glycosyltransferase involved in cell wall biosynthesis